MAQLATAIVNVVLICARLPRILEYGEAGAGTRDAQVLRTIGWNALFRFQPCTESAFGMVSPECRETTEFYKILRALRWTQIINVQTQLQRKPQFLISGTSIDCFRNSW